MEIIHVADWDRKHERVAGKIEKKNIQFLKITSLSPCFYKFALPFSTVNFQK